MGVGSPENGGMWEGCRKNQPCRWVAAGLPPDFVSIKNYSSGAFVVSQYKTPESPVSRSLSTRYRHGDCSQVTTG